MFEKEELTLNDFKERLDRLPLPLDAADGAIMQGLDRAKRESRQLRAKRKRTIWSLSAAALLILVLAATIRVSPAFANAVASIPGMEKFVELIQNDKGLHAVFENEYYQPIGESQTIGNTTLTIDGVILDESGMNIFYTLESAAEMNDITVLAPVLENKQEVPPSSISFNHPVSPEDSANIYRDILGFTFEEPVRFADLAFTLGLKVDVDGKELDFSVPFTAPENVKPSITYGMKEEVEVEGQKFTIEEVVIDPLRVGVKVSFDPANTKKILQFEDMRLEDENGEIWSSIANGISSSGDIENGEMLYYLQSNYFEKPERLYLRINRMQAVDVEDAYFLLDTDQKALLHRPKDGRLELVKASRTGFEMTMKIDQQQGHPYGIDKKITDADGTLLNLQHSGISDPYEGVQIIDIAFEDNGYSNPVKVELFAYPNYINGEVKIELKK